MILANANVERWVSERTGRRVGIFVIAETFLPPCTRLGWKKLGWVGGCVGWGGWHFGASSKINDVLAEVGGLLHVLPLAVHLNFFLADK